MRKMTAPFIAEEKAYCHKVTKEINNYNFCGFRVEAKFSDSEKTARIQSSIPLNLFLKEIKFEELEIKKDLSLSDLEDLED
jgi:hypothetical protein